MKEHLLREILHLRRRLLRLSDIKARIEKVCETDDLQGAFLTSLSFRTLACINQEISEVERRLKALESALNSQKSL